jgi:hypothetical protein
MNRARVCMILGFATTLSLGPLGGCGKKADASGEAPGAASASANAATAASASGSASAVASAKPAASVELAGTYDAKVATVRMPKDAPPFVQSETGATGAGTIALVLPAESGAVTGKASGPLGDEAIFGNLEGTVLNATVRPANGGDGAMTGTIEATVEGTGDARKVTGTLRAASADGRTVREAAFTAAKK